ncbi:hypothetical protein GCM10012288_11750 [Malaciobacter pacificus]|uniref:Uncharacterized protein n=1 Tax=Malaciobacter pacificus TaxID=1080223 RepID=A0A5C2H7T6_9BACT|nr:hypothetical protein [Malaciobacter pacificus]QEP33545.1 hypothetical protein APAC_0384 [Malaciobacter pacificus]GGD39347.1 hypothetical protein GCM10012288_11750 [Malaciobacter pacificus]
MKKILLFVAALLVTSEFAIAKNLKGLLHSRTTLEPITISVGKELAAKPYKLEAGKYYKLVLKSDGSREVPIVGAEFFRNIWVNQVSINDIEVRPLGLDGFEFDDEGEIELTFVTIKPGTYTLGLPSAKSDRERAIFIVE